MPRLSFKVIQGKQKKKREGDFENVKKKENFSELIFFNFLKSKIQRIIKSVNTILYFVIQSTLFYCALLSSQEPSKSVLG